MKAESLKPWVACLAGGMSITWILRVLWVQYGQHSRAIRLFNRVVLISHCAGLCRASRLALCRTLPRWSFLEEVVCNPTACSTNEVGLGDSPDVW